MSMTVSDVFSFMRTRRQQREQTDREKYLREIEVVDSALQNGQTLKLDALAIAADKCGYDDKYIKDHLESLQRLRELRNKQAKLQPLIARMGPVSAELTALNEEFKAFREKIFEAQRLLNEENRVAVSASAEFYQMQSELLDLENKVAKLQQP